MGITRLPPDSWKSVRGQNVSHTVAMGRGGSLSSEKAFGIVIIVKQSDLGPHCLLQRCFKRTIRRHIIDNF